VDTFVFVAPKRSVDVCEVSTENMVGDNEPLSTDVIYKVLRILVHAAVSSCCGHMVNLPF
jgi:hypothetical protein